MMEKQVQDAKDLIPPTPALYDKSGKCPDTIIGFDVAIVGEKICVVFNRSVRNMSLTPAAARELAKMLRIRASQAEGVYGPNN